MPRSNKRPHKKARGGVSVGRVGKRKDARKHSGNLDLQLTDGVVVSRGLKSDTPKRKYEQAGLRDSSKLALGRKSRKSREGDDDDGDGDDVAADGHDDSDDSLPLPADQVSADEVRALRGVPRSTGVAPPPRLTAKQQRIVKALLDAHGDDVLAMARDHKRNALQHTPAVLSRFIASYRRWHVGGSTQASAPWAWWKHGEGRAPDAENVL